MGNEADPQNNSATAGQGGDQDGNQNQHEGGEGGGSAFDESKLDEGTKNYIKSLRKEAGKYRTEAKSVKSQLEATTTKLGKYEKALKLVDGGDGEGEGKELDPEVQIGSLQATIQQQTMQMSFLAEATDRGLTSKHATLARQAFEESLEELGEDPTQEQTDEAWENAWQEAARFVYSGKSDKTKSSTSVEGNDKGGKGGGTGNGNQDAMTAEKFAKLGQTAKVELRKANPEAYDKLWNEAIAKGLIKF